MINRQIENEILEKMNALKKVFILYGARQVGKSTLAKSIIKKSGMKTLSIDGDLNEHLDILTSRDKTKLGLLAEGNELLFIDEAQRFPDIEINLKILHDHFPDLKILLTGSSAIDISDKTKEPLTGRTWTYHLYPISFKELKNESSTLETHQKLEELLIFGSYPEIFSIKGAADKSKYLKEISNSYLYKDILELSNIRQSDVLIKLLKLLAFQMGSEVSMLELSDALQISRETVASYIYLLEQAFIVFRLTGFSRNLRKEVTKKDKIYFYDLGVRNAIIDNFNLLDMRADQRQLWESFLISERIKQNHYQTKLSKNYYWRTYTGAELDYVEEGSGNLSAFEFKFGKKTSKAPKSWIENYPNATFESINRDNYFAFID